MKTDNFKRDFLDFKKEINELQSYDDGDFETKSIDSLRAMYEQIRSLCSEWRYLESDIDDAIDTIESIEE